MTKAEELETEELEKVKLHLRVTWTYEDADILDQIAEGKAFLNGIAGECVFEVGSSAFRLLKNYCRYARSGSADMFEQNYQRDLLRLQIENGRRRLGGGRDGS